MEDRTSYPVSTKCCYVEASVVGILLSGGFRGGSRVSTEPLFRLITKVAKHGQLDSHIRSCELTFHITVHIYW